MPDFAHQMIADGLRTRAAGEYPAFEEQMAAIWARHQSRTVYRTASVKDALGVPAIFSAVTLIANSVGSMSMEAYRRGSLLEQEATPRLVQRPNPFTTPRVFWRNTAFNIATRGEAWWWIAVRDPIDGSPMSLYPIPPREIVLELNDSDRLRPRIRWGDRVMRNEDVRHITFLEGEDGRGVGPLQLCGAAVSVSVEAQEWAANFFAGSIPSIIGTTDQDLNAEELEQLDEQWMEKAPNMPRWLHSGMKMTESPFDAQKAQLNDARQANVGDAARMFNMPGPLLEYQMSGSSLTYRNESGIWTDFLRRCLTPNYLEPIEQEISDLLSRSTIGRFNTKQLLRGSALERMEVHEKAIPLGIYGPEVAAAEEGYAPGSVDYAPVPKAPPQAIPTRLPVDRDAPPPVLTPFRTAVAFEEIRCPKCRRINGEAAGPVRVVCKRCGTMIERVA